MENNTNYLSKNNTDFLKLIFSFVVIFHHAFPSTNIGIVQFIVPNLGFLSVAVFFFISGYGLSLSVQKKPDYLKHFLRNRVIPFAVICIATALIYTVFELLIWKRITLDHVLSFRYLRPAVNTMYGWYLEALLASYLVFWAVYCHKKMQGFLKWILVSVGITLYAFWYFSDGGSIIVFSSIYAFVLGLIWSENRIKIDTILNQPVKTSVAFISSILLFAIAFIVQYKCYGTLLGTVARASASLLFVICVVLFLKQHPNVGNGKIVSWGRKFTFELYLLQGIFLTSFSFIANPLIRIPLILICTVVLAIGYHYFTDFIYSLFKIKE